MQNFIQKAKLVIEDKSLRKRILFTLGALAIFRLFTSIPIPGIDLLRLEQLFNNSQFLGLMNIFSGGGMSNLSIVMLGVGPYITASIIMQLLTMMFPKLKQLYHEEGDAGRKKFAQYSRLLSVPLALISAYGFIMLLQKQGVLGILTGFDLLLNALIVCAGSVMLMWLGELISEYGVGNGVSLIIFGGIVSAIPGYFSQFILSFDISGIPMYIGALILAAVVIWAVVVITESERPIPITYAKQVRGNKVYGGMSTYLPLRINQAGVMPIIFALSILLFPQMILSFLGNATNETVNAIANWGVALFNNPWFYSIFYFVLVFLFTYFYTAVTFDPEAISTNLQKSGAFIPGVRPGLSTSQYLAKIVTRITFVGAVFLGLIAVLPLIMRAFTGMQSLAIGGTALLIVVSVAIDLLKKLDAQVSMREY